MKKILIRLMLVLSLLYTPVLAESAGPTPAPEAAELVRAVYELRYNTKATCEEAVLTVYDNGTSEMTICFTHTNNRNYTPPDGAFLRLTKVDGQEGNYGQAPVTVVSKGKNLCTEMSATIPFDRAFGKAEFITVSYCRSDGKEQYALKFQLKDFDSADGKWPEPEFTPEVPTIPPVKPTPTPTPRPTLIPGATEPPQEKAEFSVNYVLREATKHFVDLSAVLRVYDEMSALTVQFRYEKEIAGGTVMRMTMADGRMGYYGEGPIITLADGTHQATILFNQQVGPLTNFNLEAYAPGEQLRSFKAFYKQKGNRPDGWSEMDPIGTTQPAATPTPTPLPEDVTPTPAPTLPSESRFVSQARYALLDPVKQFTLKEATHRRYEGGQSVLKIEFYYEGELPANGILRITQAEYTEGNFGEAVIEKGEGELLTATIITDRLQGSLQAFRLRCYDAKEKEQFYADFAVTIANSRWAGGYEAAIARNILPTATPEPEEETPAPTVTVAATEPPDASATPAPTEPPYADARSKRKFEMLDKVKGYVHFNTTLRRYEEFDVLTVYFRTSSELPEGAVMRLTQADTTIDRFGEALILPSELKDARKDLVCAKIASDRIPLNCKGLRLKIIGPDGSELYTVDYIADERGVNKEDVRSMLHAAPSPTPSAEPGAEPSPSPTP